MTKKVPPNNETLQLKQWNEQVNILCHDIFLQSEKGMQLLNLWEQRYFMSPTADPSLHPDYAFFNEGRNNFIRGIRLAAYAAMSPPQTTQLKKDIEHEREIDEI